MPFKLSLLMLLFSTLVVSGQKLNGTNEDCVPPKPVARQQGPHGSYPLKDGATAIISVQINKKGQVSDPSLLQSSGNGAYDRDAVNLIRHWQYEPSTCKGKPLAVRLEITMKYSPTQSASH